MAKNQSTVKYTKKYIAKNLLPKGVVKKHIKEYIDYLYRMLNGGCKNRSH